MFGQRVESARPAIENWKEAFNAADARRRQIEEASAQREAEARRQIEALQAQAQTSKEEEAKAVTSLATDKVRSIEAVAKLADLLILSWWISIARGATTSAGKGAEFLADLYRVQDATIDLGMAYFVAITADEIPWQPPDETRFRAAVRHFQSRHGSYVLSRGEGGEEERLEMPRVVIEMKTSMSATAEVLPPDVSVKGQPTP